MKVDQRGSKRNNSEGKQKNNDSLKVVYISSPMKVKTSASRFRSLVQQLTGKNSDITQYMDVDNNNNNRGVQDFYDCDDQSLAKETMSHPYQIYSSSISPYDTPTSSDSLTGSGSVDDIFTSDQFDGIFTANSFYDPLELDVLGSFEGLL